VRALPLLAMLASCSSRHDSSPPPPQVPRDAAPVPSFAREIEPVFAKHCTGKDCHGNEPSINITLDLRPAAAYRQLVDAPAEMGALHLMRVKPGDPDDSMLVHKLTGRLGFKEGKRMPIDSNSGEPIVPSPLPPAFVEGVVAPWIRAGSPNN
jgi:hypothetical protein